MKIQLDFEGQTLRFENPIAVIQTNELSKIKQKVSEIEQYAQQGYYVAGYLAYESATAFNPFNLTKNANDNKLPLLLFGVFKQYCAPVDVGLVSHSKAIKPLNLISNTSLQTYNETIDAIHEQIKQGNSYQINYAIQFSSKLNKDVIDDPFGYYQYLQTNNRANYCAYIEFCDLHILSISPELFFKLDNNHITTKPMKGTSARGRNNQEDKLQLTELLSVKNQAENMMIVDLLRNDLSRISQVGTVNVTKLFEAEKYPTVWQLTSTIQSQLKLGTRLFDIFQALFPCGSITGAPKASSMKIIANLEKENREVYCGTIGYIAPHLQNAAFNIPIRTLTISNGTANYGVGGGITWDSTQRGEYNEVLEKTAILSKPAAQPSYLIESLLLDDGHYFLLDAHLERLIDSAHYFDFSFDPRQLCNQLQTLAKLNNQGKFKIRVTLNCRGELVLEPPEQLTPMQINSLQLAQAPVNSQNVFLYHKTNNRSHFPTICAGRESLCYNQKGEVTEFVNGNIVLLIDNQWQTPKLTSGLLAGTMRSHLLNQGKIIEQTILLTEVNKADKIAFINSVRGWVEIEPSVLNALKLQISSSEIMVS